MGYSFQYELRSFHTKSRDLEKQVRQIERTTNERCAQLMSAIARMQHAADSMHESLPKLLEKKDIEIEKLQAEIDDLKEQLAQSEFRKEPAPQDPELDKACTIAIFDSILFAIENWASDGSTAPDFSLACQAVLFPLVYQPVMKGNEAYVLTTVPDSALEVVKRGREYVQFIRGQCQTSLTDPAAWPMFINIISGWWINDALPLLYGARDPAWEREIQSLSLEQILSWRDQPASRALDFPLVFDAMDLLERHREAIRETTKLPEFTRNTLNTRLEIDNAQ